jgi:hypothetical protein
VRRSCGAISRRSAIAGVKRQRSIGWALNRPMLVLNARRAAKAANLVRSAMDPRDIGAFDLSESAGPRFPAKDSPKIAFEASRGQCGTYSRSSRAA